MRSSRPEFLYHLDEAATARNGGRQMGAIKACYDALHTEMLHSADRFDGLVEKALEASKGDLRKLRTLEFCTSAIYDKIPLPAEDGSFPEFLWLFAVPFTVTFAPEALAQHVSFKGQVIDAQALISELDAIGYCNPHGILRASTKLFKREDLQVMGPRKLGQMVLQAEQSGEDRLEPLPLMLDSELDAYRSVTMFMLVSCRLPVGTTSLFNRNVPWPAETFARVVQASMVSQGVQVESVVSHIPHTITEMHLRCNGPALAELQANLGNGRKAYGNVEVGVRFDVSGYAEIVGKLPDEDDGHIILIPPFTYFEADSELLRVVEGMCAGIGLPFAGGRFSSRHAVAGALH
ncbi:MULTISPECIES: hypothetical protein [unclassified Variovorax]|uniref:hypothetical protein n=1 Tax=unclassified Variovorax TaxID=663243 RepID=UPI00076D80EB|nr:MULTISPECIES: hypothetical protein [unclassified Variovorax]KWT98413.1 hypothetical protein APY03_0548 [Variovorax sp. WDL1]PNG49918.1 hypothetical protein CHC06_05499 [Variovorax sp. B2]PNG50790.1 hypothetical protein CHC07_05404 [Variovorax sp. B4]VTV18010.1 hypothetical protein WDL1P1_00842 [Variovorax sp. WDL1]